MARIIKCYQKNSAWYKGSDHATPVGILWHDTNGGNPYIKRYAQPFETDSNFREIQNILGINRYKNDWNHVSVQKGVNAFIGKIADESIATLQAGDWTLRPWGCGKGSKGSLNGTIIVNGKQSYSGKFWIQFEICDDGYRSKEYLESVYKEACELTAYLCETYGIDPNGYVNYNGVKVPTILCHGDAAKLGFASNHEDIYPWFTKFGKTMASARADVQKIMNGTAKEETSFSPYVVRITASALNVRKGPGITYGVAMTIQNGGSYTIVEESKGEGSKTGWGKLKSGAGWISLDYAEKK